MHNDIHQTPLLQPRKDSCTTDFSPQKPTESLTTANRPSSVLKKEFSMESSSSNSPPDKSIKKAVSSTIRKNEPLKKKQITTYKSMEVNLQKNPSTVNSKDSFEKKVSSQNSTERPIERMRSSDDVNTKNSFPIKEQPSLKQPTEKSKKLSTSSSLTSSRESLQKQQKSIENNVQGVSISSNTDTEALKKGLSSHQCITIEGNINVDKGVSSLLTSKESLKRKISTTPALYNDEVKHKSSITTDINDRLSSTLLLKKDDVSEAGTKQRVEKDKQDMPELKPPLVSSMPMCLLTTAIEAPQIEYIEVIKEFDGPIKELPKKVLVPTFADEVIEEPVPIKVEKIVEKIEFEFVEMIVEKIEEEVEFEEKIIYQDVVENDIVEVPVYTNKVVQSEEVIRRHLPSPVELIAGWKFRTPQLCSNQRVQKLPVYVPRFVEVPVASAYLTDTEFEEALSLYSSLRELALNPSPTLLELSELAERAKNSAHIIRQTTSEASTAALQNRLKRHFESEDAPKVLVT